MTPPHWEEEFRTVIREQGARLARLEQIIRRRDEVITLVREMTRNWTPASKNYIDDDVDTILAALARLDVEEAP